jgi:hypothetical protein
MKIIENFIDLEDCKSIIDFLDFKDVNNELIIASDGRKIFKNKENLLMIDILNKYLPKIKQAWEIVENIKPHIVWFVKYENTMDLPLHTDIITEECNNDYLSIVFYLNDEYEGGEITFPRLNKDLHPNLGTAIIMDLHDKTYEHSVKSVISGIKYIVAICIYKF